ncbi:hypothetical protein [Clostridium sp. C105KSO13]|uniref:hypothetical protein n=1 Tax=Clostridium sp. C105KSO13 TaxID=1776045 RepID=UPI0007408544|nr:hypothetical protein [Clostridium sp. C105KSO13]CUX33723.1 hypothetical protein BN3456_01507 [Clostridium sp. C105KSO13]
MKKAIKSMVMVIVVAGLAFLYSHIEKNVYLYDRHSELESYVQTGVLLEGETISQTFSSKEEVLNGINLKSMVVGPPENVVLEYTITDNETGEATTETVQGTEIKSNKFNKYTFPEISNAKGREYTLTLKETGTNVNEGISFYVDTTENKEGTLTIRENETEGTLVVRLISHRFDTETFIVLLGFIAFIVVFIKVLYKLFK